MRLRQLTLLSTLALLAVWCGGAATSYAVELAESIFDQGLSEIRYSGLNEGAWMDSDQSEFDTPVEDNSFREGSASRPGAKSPTKAMLMSMVVPGLGQLYYGSKTKAALFFGADVASWFFQFKLHGDGEDMEDEFEAFNRAHWSRSDYEDVYLMLTYGVDDDNLATATEISHHLPDTRTQQYYEMTGKYNQFAWGWDDAELNGDSLESYSVGNPPPPITNASTTPYSANRFLYEQMRDDANTKFDNARKLIMVSILNRLVAGFEAYFVTKGRQRQRGGLAMTNPKIKVRALLKSYHTPRDTPYVRLAYQF